jgi:hypothetical protein
MSVASSCMARNAVVCRILIASPSDVEKERQVIASVIERWNAANSKSMGLVLEPVRWESHARPASGSYPQGLINQQIVDDADLVVGVFWCRLGTPTPVADSGTIEEIEYLRRRSKQVLLYFSTAAIPQSFDKNQFEKLQQYKSGLKKDTLYWEFATPEELDRVFSRHLAAVAHELAKDLAVAPSGSPARVSNLVTLKPLSKPRYVSPDDSDTWREAPKHEDSVLAAIAIFQNQQMPGLYLPHITGLTARITFYEANGGEVERIYNGCWLGDPFNHTDLGVGDTVELILALVGPDSTQPMALENTRSKAIHYEHEGTRGKPLERHLYDVTVTLIGTAKHAGDVYEEFRFNVDLREEVPVLKRGWTERRPLS